MFVVFYHVLSCMEMRALMRLHRQTKEGSLSVADIEREETLTKLAVMSHTTTGACSFGRMACAEDSGILFAPGAEGNEVLAFDIRALSPASSPAFKLVPDHHSGLLLMNINFFLSFFLSPVLQI